MKKGVKIVVLALVLGLCIGAGAYYGVRAWRTEWSRLADRGETQSPSSAPTQQALPREEQTQPEQPDETAALEEQLRLELEAVEEFSGVLDAEGIADLDQYPNLQSVDLSGSTDYGAILAYQQAHREVHVRYTVNLGSFWVDSDTESLSLPAGSAQLDTLREGLRWLPNLKALTLEELSCAPEEIAALRQEYPDKEIRYSVRLLDTVYPDDTQSLDLSWLEPEQVGEAASALALLNELQEADLTDENGENRLGLTELRQLQEARPATLFRYRTKLFGKEISTEDTRIEFVRVSIGNEGEAQLREILPCLTRCEYFLLDDCGLDNEVLARLREDFPQPKIVWRVHISYLNFLTDVKIIHLTFLLTNQNAQVMRYCNEVEYLDIGHNTISDITFMGYMPHLKYVILSYNKVSNLSPLANCKELEMLELYQCLNLEDISPLAECPSLKLLNVSWCDIKDISPVFGLENLERFYCIWNYEIPQELMDQAFRELPNCWITFEQNVSKNVGWSFDAAGGVRAQWYLDMYKILRYRVEDWFFGDYPEGWNQEEETFESEGT